MRLASRPAFKENTELFGLNAVFAKLFKPNALGLTLCVIAFSVASIALAAAVSLGQEKSTTQYIQAVHNLERYDLGQQSTLTLAPDTKLNVVSYADRIELYVLKGAISAWLNEQRPVHIHAGQDVIKTQQAQLTVTYVAGSQAEFVIAEATR